MERNSGINMSHLHLTEHHHRRPGSDWLAETAGWLRLDGNGLS
jgi:hypothetical protein